LPQKNGPKYFILFIDYPTSFKNWNKLHFEGKGPLLARCIIGSISGMFTGGNHIPPIVHTSRQLTKNTPKTDKFN